MAPTKNRTGKGYRFVLLLAFLLLVMGRLKLVKAQEVNGSVTYASFIGSSFQAPFYYSDDYFTAPSVAYSDSLSTMSLCLSLSAFASEETDDYRYKAEHLSSLLEQCGFDMGTFMINDAFTQKPGPDTIGAGAASKQITDENGDPCWLIACAIRGLGYETEWAGNFTLGEKDEHQGFQDAALKVISFLQEYSEANPQISGNVKLWITGYSRAAAVTNLTAAMIDEGRQISSRFTLGTDTVFAYCFECPQGTLITLNPHNARYQNIFSIVNQGDLVPELAPTMPPVEYGFTHYGTVLYLPYAAADHRLQSKPSVQKMLRYYNQLEGTEDYPPGAFQMKQLSILNILTGYSTEQDSTWSQPFFVKSMVASLAAMIGDRTDYTGKYQTSVRKMIEIMFSSGASGNVMKHFSSNLREKSVELATATAASMLFGKEEVLNILEKALTDAMDECGITDYSREEIHFAMDTLSELLIQFGSNHPDYVVTLAYNLKSIATNHFPELCLAWLMSFDPNYGEGNHSDFVSGYYRLLQISSPESLTLLDASGNEISEMPEYAAYTDEDGVMWVELPLDKDCTFRLIPWENASTKVELDEFSDQYGLVRVVRYYDVELAKDRPWTLSVEAAKPVELQQTYDLKGGTGSSCVLTDDAGNQMPPSEEMTGLDTLWEIFRIRSFTNDTQYGWADGGGIGYPGDYEMVNAYPLDGCRFTGWYENDTLVSDEPSYRFLIEGDRALEARFEPASGE